jgi:hypothetical protein
MEMGARLDRPEVKFAPDTPQVGVLWYCLDNDIGFRWNWMRRSDLAGSSIEVVSGEAVLLLELPRAGKPE